LKEGEKAQEGSGGRVKRHRKEMEEWWRYKNRVKRG
jgi:hypothetical protein